MTDREKLLIQRATDTAWNAALRHDLALVVQDRGGLVSRHDHCGDLVEKLEDLARADA